MVRSRIAPARTPAAPTPVTRSTAARATPPRRGGGREPLADARTRILDAATALLAERGWQFLTQPRVCKKSGLRQSHLTYYFPTRRDLMIGVAQRSMEALSQPLLARARSGRLTAAALARTLGEELADRGRVRVMIGLISAAEEDPAIAEALRDLIVRVRGRLSTLFKALGLPDDADSVAMAHTLLVGAAMLHHARADVAARREIRLASQFIVTRISVPGRRQPARKAGAPPVRKAAG